MQGWSPPSAPWLLAPPPREPGPTDQHAPKDGPQGWPVQPGQSVGSSHFSPTPLGTSFPSVQLSSARLVSRSPFLYPGQCKPSPSAGRKLGFRWPSPCCWFPAEHGPLGLLVLRTARVRPPPSLPRLDQPSTHSAASPSTSSVLTKRTQSFVCASLF